MTISTQYNTLTKWKKEKNMKKTKKGKNSWLMDSAWTVLECVNYKRLYSEVSIIQSKLYYLGLPQLSTPMLRKYIYRVSIGELILHFIFGLLNSSIPRSPPKPIP